MPNNIAIYPGSFDPVTLGHLDVIRRASHIFDKVIVAVLRNSTKKNVLFSVEDRVKMIQDCVSDLEGVEAKSFDGLLVDFAKSEDCHILVKGIRDFTDYEYELKMAIANRTMSPGLETVYLTTDPSYSHISSSLVKEIASYGGDIELFLPKNIVPLVQKKYL